MYSNDEVNWFLEELSTSPAQLRLLDLSLGRLLKKAAADAEDWRMLCTDDQARQISEWLTKSIHDDAAWLKSLDDFGRPRKLMKFTTVAQIEKEAAKTLQKAARRPPTPSMMIAQARP
ncbi:hypothetical protein [Mesorhizobium sp. SP-1A]|uniref:hypothetical protein n=1 Tax=Mesorhizobium sp. SP-1A TaxID=3077840 RepID=UPI0028F73EB1|nr:hypothetical protein [Mesorhizobium sp. SP-1A]